MYGKSSSELPLGFSMALAHNVKSFNATLDYSCQMEINKANLSDFSLNMSNKAKTNIAPSEVITKYRGTFLKLALVITQIIIPKIVIAKITLHNIIIKLNHNSLKK